MHSTNAQNSRPAIFGMLAALASSLGQTYFIGLFGSAIRADLSLGPGLFGSVYGLATLTSGALMFWLGAVADRVSMKRAVMFAGSLLVGGAFCISFAHGPWLLAAAFFLLRLGGQGLMGHIAIVAAARTKASRRGRTLAIAVSGFIVGEALWPMIVISSLSRTDWRELWIVFALAMMFIGLPLLSVLAGRLHAPATSSAERGRTALSRMELLKTRRFVAAMGVVLVPPFVITAIFFHLGTLAELRSWTKASLAGGFVVFAFAQLAAAWTAGRVIDRFGAIRPLRFHLLPLAAAILVLGLMNSTASTWLMFAGLGATAGANSVLGGAFWSEAFGAHQVGMVRGVYSAFSVLATAMAPVLFGLTLGAPGLLTFALGACAVYCVCGPLLLSRSLRSPQP